MTDTIDEQTCPFCGGQNHCMVNSDQPCWCVQKTIPAEMIELLPDHLKRKACICSRCVDLFAGDPETFTREFSG